MVELIGDPCIPSTLVLPIKAADAMSGAIFISGAKIWFCPLGAVGDYEIVTSA